MTVSFIGSGNVATHMAQAFYDAGFNMLEIYSRDAAHAASLAKSVDALPVTNCALMQQADLLVIAVKDDAISDIAAALPPMDGVVVHTSGSMPISLLSRFKKYGVFYPLQTFSKTKTVDFKKVPLCLEGSDEKIMGFLSEVAGKVSESLTKADSGQRKYLHLAAVFACNFTNHLYTLSETILLNKGLQFDLLKPLIAETAAKIAHLSPADVQTGPAIRADEKVMSLHKALLSNDADLQELYTVLSNSIKKHHS